jgi:phosphoenolpyruvate synthase/pyruvate phosphate dikinase
MKLEPWLVEELTTRLRQTFGPDGTYGVFVRSDTNAEDLPQFTGAGLNLTLPNVVGEANILQALKEVWASPFEERAWAWRSEALESSDRVYPSVVILRTVPSAKSGVMATANLSTLDMNDLTVNVNEGVAAVVDGGVSESLLLEANGKVRLLAQARSEYRKVPLPKGGFTKEPASGSDYVLTEAEIARLRRLSGEVKAKLKTAKDDGGADLPWDIEFGFEDGELRLFQIRPLVRYREARTLEALGSLEAAPRAVRAVALDEPVEDR